MAADEERLPGPAGLDVCGLQIIDYGGRGHTATLDLHKKNQVLLKSKFEKIVLTILFISIMSLVSYDVMLLLWVEKTFVKLRSRFRSIPGPFPVHHPPPANIS